MTDMTFAPMVVNAFLVTLIITDLITGWTIFGTIVLMGLIAWNALLLYLTYGPQKPSMTHEEFKAEYPELWEKWYFPEAWNGFWDLQDSLLNRQEIEK